MQHPASEVILFDFRTVHRAQVREEMNRALPVRLERARPDAHMGRQGEEWANPERCASRGSLSAESRVEATTVVCHGWSPVAYYRMTFVEAADLMIAAQPRAGVTPTAHPLTGLAPAA